MGLSSSSSILVSWFPLGSVGGEEMEVRMACPRKAVPLRAKLKDHKRGLHDSVSKAYDTFGRLVSGT